MSTINTIITTKGKQQTAHNQINEKTDDRKNDQTTEKAKKHKTV